MPLEMTENALAALEEEDMGGVVVVCLADLSVQWSVGAVQVLTIVKRTVQSTRGTMVPHMRGREVLIMAAIPGSQNDKLKI